MAREGWGVQVGDPSSAARPPAPVG